MARPVDLTALTTSDDLYMSRSCREVAGSGNALDLYPGGARFEFWLEHRPSCHGFRDFLQSLRATPGLLPR